MTGESVDFRRLHWRLRHRQVTWRHLKDLAEETLRSLTQCRRGHEAQRIRPTASIFGELDAATDEAERSLRSGRADSLVDALVRGQRLRKDLDRCKFLFSVLDAFDHRWAELCSGLPLRAMQGLPSVSSCRRLREQVQEFLEAGDHHRAAATLALLECMVERWQGAPKNSRDEALKRCAGLLQAGAEATTVESLQSILESSLAPLGEQLLDELQIQNVQERKPLETSPRRDRHRRLIDQSQETTIEIGAWLESRRGLESESSGETPEDAAPPTTTTHVENRSGEFNEST